MISDKSLAILVVDENLIRAAIIETGLREAGHRNVTLLHDINGVMREIERNVPDVIVIDLENPNRDHLERMFQLSRSVQRPIAMFVDQTDRASIEAAIDAGVSAYVVNGLKKERIKPILDIAVSRFNTFSSLRQELSDARSELLERKSIEKAKGILMAAKGLSEQQAYSLLRKTAMNQNRKIIDIAQSIITASVLLDSSE